MALSGTVGQSGVLLLLEMVLEVGDAVHDGSPVVAADVVRRRVAGLHDAMVDGAVGGGVGQRWGDCWAADAGGGQARCGRGPGSYRHDQALELLDALVHAWSDAGDGGGIVRIGASVVAGGAGGARQLAIAAESAGTTPLAEELSQVLAETAGRGTTGSDVLAAATEIARELYFVAASTRTDTGTWAGLSISNVLSVLGVLGILSVRHRLHARGRVHSQDLCVQQRNP